MVTPTYKRNTLKRNTSIRQRNTCFFTFSVDCFFFLIVAYNAFLKCIFKDPTIIKFRYNQSFTHTEEQSEIKLLFLSLTVFTSYPFPLMAVYENHDKLLAIVPLSLHDQTAICS